MSLDDLIAAGLGAVVQRLITTGREVLERGPDPALVAERARAEAAALRESDREFYSKLGSERATIRCRATGCSRGAIALSVFCRAHHFERIMSMYPTIGAGDRVMVSKLSHRPERGDIIAFRALDSQDTHLKRIVGLPGDHMDFRGDDVVVNGRRIDRQPVALPCRDSSRCKVFEERLGERRYRVALARDFQPPASDPVTVPSDHVFVLGDNRHNSFDSRAFGPVPLENVIGRYVFTWWSGSP